MYLACASEPLFDETPEQFIIKGLEVVHSAAFRSNCPDLVLRIRILILSSSHDKKAAFRNIGKIFRQRFHISLREIPDFSPCCRKKAGQDHNLSFGHQTHCFQTFLYPVERKILFLQHHKIQSPACI